MVRHLCMYATFVCLCQVIHVEVEMTNVSANFNGFIEFKDS